MSRAGKSLVNFTITFRICFSLQRLPANLPRFGKTLKFVVISSPSFHWALSDNKPSGKRGTILGEFCCVSPKVGINNGTGTKIFEDEGKCLISNPRSWSRSVAINEDVSECCCLKPRVWRFLSVHSHRLESIFYHV